MNNFFLPNNRLLDSYRAMALSKFIKIMATNPEFQVAINNLGAQANEKVTLVDAATITWNFELGNIAEVTLEGNRTLAMSNVPAHSTGILIVSQGSAGNRTLVLPNNKEVGLSLSTGINNKDILSFYYDGSYFFWSISKFGAVEGFPTLEDITWSQLANATNSGSGTITGANTTTPAGGTATKKFGTAEGSFVQTTIGADLTAATGNPLALDNVNDANYTWNSAGNTTLANVYIFSSNYQAQSGATTGGATNTGIAAVAGDVMRLVKSGNDVLLRRSTDGGNNFTTIHTFTGVLSGITDVFIKAMFTANATNKVVNLVKGFNMLAI